MKRKTFRLCYIEPDSPFAWFTTARLKDQWGDDWNDAPYECNAGWPSGWYEGSKCASYELMRLAFWHPLYETPAQRCISVSVEQISAGEVAWLTTSSLYSSIKRRSSEQDQSTQIMAGCTLDEFKRLIRETEGEIYVLEPGV